MNDFNEYSRFSDMESAEPTIKQLEEHNIPFVIEDTTLRFNVVPNVDPFENIIILKINEEDRIKVDKLLEPKNEQFSNEITPELYLYTFSDDDIIDIIANPSDWTVEEQTIAKQIVKNRGLSFTAEIIRQARIKNNNIKKESDNESIKNNRETKVYGWFLTIAILSIINTIIIASEINVRFIFGLGFSQLIDGLFYSLLGGFKFIGILFSFLYSGIFIVIWYFAKAKKNWAYIIGLVLYGLDMLIFIYFKDWLSTGFHILPLILILYGFLDKRESQNDAQ